MANMTCKEFDRALAMEWAVISTGAAARRALLRWGEAESALADAETPADLVDKILTAPEEESIAVTQAVLRLARSDRLAARLLIQLMVPTLATECFRSLRMLKAERVPVTSSEVVALVIGAAAESIGSYARRPVVPYPLRTIRRRMIEIVIARRNRMIRQAEVESVQFAETTHTSADPSDTEPTPAELLADTLTTAVDLGIVSGQDAQVVWLSRRFDVSALAQADNDAREHERLRRRRSRTQRRLIENRELLLDAGLAG